MFQIVMAGFIFMILYVMYRAVKNDDYAPRKDDKFDIRRNSRPGPSNRSDGQDT